MLGSPGPLSGPMLKGLLSQHGLPESEQLLTVLHQMPKVKAPLGFGLMGPKGADIITQVCVCVMGVIQSHQNMQEWI